LEKNGAEVNRGAQAENDPWVKDTLAKLDAVNPVRQTANPAEQAANGAGYAVNPAEQANNAAASAAYPAGHVDDAAASVDSPAARWAEFHDFRQLEPGRGSRLNLQPMLQPQEDQLWVRPRVQREREHHFPFLTLAVPGFAATLAVGALLWSGSLRDRVHQQDAAMNALQEQNQKLADTLAQMNVDQKATSALNGSSDSTNTPAGDAAQKDAAQKDAAQKDENGVPSLQQQSVPPATQQATASTATEQPEPASPQSANLAGASVQRQSAREPGNRQGVSTPPPVGESSRQHNGRYRAPVQTGYKPELVPPYPTTFQPQNVAANAAASQPVPSAGYKPPMPVSSGTSSGPLAAGTASAGTAQAGTVQAAPQAYVPPVSVPSSSAARSSQTAVPQAGVSRPAKASVERAAPLPSTPNNAAASTYNAAADGSYASPLAQNIEAVEGLQRHSPIPLREFHVDAGRFAKLTPSLGVSVRHPDSGHGTYALLVDEGNGKHYQLAGQVNSPLTLIDNATRRGYALVVLRIDNQQVYGYVRPMQ
jgi:hypothetical protein